MSALSEILLPVPMGLFGFSTRQESSVQEQAPNNQIDTESMELYLQNNFEYLKSLRNISMPSELLNSDFSALSAKGTTPTTQADGDNVEFIGDWYVTGSSTGTYSLTPTAYAANSRVRSASDYYVNLAVSSYSGPGFYIYQRINSIRKFQSSYLTLSFIVENNTNDTVVLNSAIKSYYDTGSKLQSGSNFSVQSGIHTVSSTYLIELIR